jgi:uncharacterized protein YceK
MNVRPRPLVILLVTVVSAASLSGCAAVNQKASEAMGDYIPQWAGGLPADAPPRPGTARYEAYMKERERLRQMPASERPQDGQPSSNPSSGMGQAPGPAR